MEGVNKSDYQKCKKTKKNIACSSLEKNTSQRDKKSGWKSMMEAIFGFTNGAKIPNDHKHLKVTLRPPTPPKKVVKILDPHLGGIATYYNQKADVNMVHFVLEGNRFMNGDCLTFLCKVGKNVTNNSCDWIGLFPKEWKKTSAYVTFEWVKNFPIMNQINCSIIKTPNKSMTFYNKGMTKTYKVNIDTQHIKEKLDTTNHYYLLYVNENGKVLGQSQRLWFYKPERIVLNPNFTINHTENKLPICEDYIKWLEPYILKRFFRESVGRNVSSNYKDYSKYTKGRTIGKMYRRVLKDARRKKKKENVKKLKPKKLKVEEKSLTPHILEAFNINVSVKNDVKKIDFNNEPPSLKNISAKNIFAKKVINKSINTENEDTTSSMSSVKAVQSFEISDKIKSKKYAINKRFKKNKSPKFHSTIQADIDNTLLVPNIGGHKFFIKKKSNLKRCLNKEESVRLARLSALNYNAKRKNDNEIPTQSKKIIINTKPIIAVKREELKPFDKSTAPLENKAINNEVLKKKVCMDVLPFKPMSLVEYKPRSEKLCPLEFFLQNKNQEIPKIHKDVEPSLFHATIVIKKQLRPSLIKIISKDCTKNKSDTLLNPQNVNTFFKKRDKSEIFTPQNIVKNEDREKPNMDQNKNGNHSDIHSSFYSNSRLNLLRMMELIKENKQLIGSLMTMEDKLEQATRDMEDKNIKLINYQKLVHEYDNTFKKYDAFGKFQKYKESNDRTVTTISGVQNIELEELLRKNIQQIKEHQDILENYLKLESFLIDYIAKPLNTQATENFKEYDLEYWISYFNAITYINHFYYGVEQKVSMVMGFLKNSYESAIKGVSYNNIVGSLRYLFNELNGIEEPIRLYNRHQPHRPHKRRPFVRIEPF
ncbi:unnamed protein product [Gordionus sp. m RMFG-2023]|uniref:uncharacterized protein LOC135923858 n=1 Tax=Gordionus sp. m RMFG-2023 TaxID=3053472 RepID=UPI0030E31952